MALQIPVHAETNLVGRIVSSAVTTTATSIAAQFTDSKTGDARTPQADTLYFTIDKDNSRFEIIQSSSHSTTNGVTTITVATNGRAIPLFGIGAGGATGTQHPIGAQIGCVDIHKISEVLNNWMDGTEGSSGTSLRVGDETDVDITFFAQNADANKPFLQYDSATSAWLFSNDGSSTAAIGGSTATFTAGDGLTLTAGDFDVDTSDTVIFVKTSSGAGDEDKVPILDASGTLADGFISTDTLANRISDVTATFTEINDALDGISANVTDTNLNTLTAGAASDASALHSHATESNDYYAYEVIPGGHTACLKPIQVEYFSQLTDAALALGDANARRRYAMRFTPSQVPTFTTLNLRGRESGNSTMTLSITIETDNAGGPSGTPVANGTAAGLDTSTWGAAFASRTATFPGVPTLVAGTTYWLVIAVGATDAAHYVELSDNSAAGWRNFLPFERQTFDQDALTWGASTNNNIPFFWTVDVPGSFGVGICRTDADFGGRTWDFLGIAGATASSFGDLIAVNSGVTAGFSALHTGAYYYISAELGTLTLTPPANEVTGSAYSFRVARAVSASEMLIELGPKRMTYYQANVGATTIQLIPWFKPQLIELNAVSQNAATASSSSGTWDGTTDQCVYTWAEGGGFGFGTNQTDVFFVRDNAAAVQNSGDFGSLTDVGATLTATRDAGVQNVTLLGTIYG